MLTKVILFRLALYLVSKSKAVQQAGQSIRQITENSGKEVSNSSAKIGFSQRMGKDKGHHSGGAPFPPHSSYFNRDLEFRSFLDEVGRPRLSAISADYEECICDGTES